MTKIMKIICLIMVSFQSAAMSEAEKKSVITKPITNLFDAMREHDDKKLLNQFTNNAILERVTTENTIKSSDLKKFAQAIKKSEKYLDEQLFNIHVSQSDNLASVWTPFAFYLDGKLSHCGVNSFQLIQVNNEWKIRYLIDNQHLGDCKTFIEKHKKIKSH